MRVPIPCITLHFPCPCAAGQICRSRRRPANLPSQPVGPNDLIAVSVYDAPELSRTIRVGADGYFPLPMLKQRLKANGLLPGGSGDRHHGGASRGADPGESRRHRHHRRVPQPPDQRRRRREDALVFQAEGPTTLLEAIARAQGLPRRCRPRDPGQPLPARGRMASPSCSPAAISVRGLIDDADPALNVTLTGGEEIRVPEVSKIYVMGNVKKPAPSPCRMAPTPPSCRCSRSPKGLSPFANKQAFIYRREAAGSKNEIAVPLDKIMKRQAPDVTLTANDILYIPDNRGKRIGMAALEKLLLFGGTAGATALIYTR